MTSDIERATYTVDEAAARLGIGRNAAYSAKQGLAWSSGPSACATSVAGSGSRQAERGEPLTRLSAWRLADVDQERGAA